METLHLLTNPDAADMRQIVLTALIAGLSVVVMCGILSPLVVIKRLGFVGQYPSVISPPGPQCQNRPVRPQRRSRWRPPTVSIQRRVMRHCVRRNAWWRAVGSNAWWGYPHLGERGLVRCVRY